MPLLLHRDVDKREAIQSKNCKDLGLVGVSKPSLT